MFATAKLGAVFVPVNTRLAAARDWPTSSTTAAPALLLVEDGLADVRRTPPVAALGLDTVGFTRAAGAGLDTCATDDDRPRSTSRSVSTTSS